jgi:SAM-dependent methyltransferase
MSENTPGEASTYFPEIFEVNSLESAMQIILTPGAGTTTQERWEKETPFLVDEIGRALELDDKSCVLDYGCGVGRLAKGLIERHNCFVLGVDISTSMRQLAPGYVWSDRFSVCTPQMLDRMVVEGLRVTHAYACWVIQHCMAPDEDLARIESALTGGGKLFVLNANGRWVPTDRGWASDSVSVEELLARRFEKISKGKLPEGIATPTLISNTFSMTLRKRG